MNPTFSRVSDSRLREEERASLLLLYYPGRTPGRGQGGYERPGCCDPRYYGERSSRAYSGKDVWNLSAKTAWSAVTSLGGSIRSRSRLSADNDLDADAAPDGVTATELIEDLVIVPGYYKLDGYSMLPQAIDGRVRDRGMWSRRRPSRQFFPVPV